MLAKCFTKYLNGYIIALGASQVAQYSKNPPPANAGDTGVGLILVPGRSPGGKELATNCTPSCLKNLWTEEPGRHGVAKWDMTEELRMHTHIIGFICQH